MEETERHSHISVTVGFPTATVYDVRGGLSVNKGVSFTLGIENFKHPLEWFADNDHVLDIKVSADSLTASIVALAEGDSEIEVQYRKNTVKLIKVIVTEIQEPQATGLQATVDNPVPK